MVWYVVFYVRRCALITMGSVMAMTADFILLFKENIYFFLKTSAAALELGAELHISETSKIL
jgi:hypothetical protein